MKIGIIDADLVGRTRHRFPNLACIKISGYHKAKGDEVVLITNYNPDSLNRNRVFELRTKYDKIYVSKVFVDTAVPYELLNMDNVTYGGSGFFFSDADPLPPEIEHHMPDYDLYTEWIEQELKSGKPESEFNYYINYSLGYTTRGCVRHCKFCINKHCNKVEKASNVYEFLDTNKRWICLLDDNVLAYENWKEIIEDLNATGKQFEFKQGLDIRSLNKEKAQVLVKSNLYINGIYFAFDNIEDRDIIEEKLAIWRKYYRKHTNMYVLCGFDKNNKYNEDFWAKDIEDTFERIKICMKYNIFPYVMRYRQYRTAPSPYYGMYVNLASWCNQKGTIIKMSLNEWADNLQKATEKRHGNKKLYSAKRYNMEYAGKFPDLAYEYFDVKYENISEYEYDRVSNHRTLPNSNDENEEAIPETIDTSENILSEEEKAQFIENNSIEIKKRKEDLKNQLKDERSSNKNNHRFLRKYIAELESQDISTIILNSKSELNDIYRSVILLSNLLLKEKSNLFIHSDNLKSFTIVKEFVENNTVLKFQEVITFTTSTGVCYCSRYSMIDNINIFNTGINYNRNGLLKEIIAYKTKENDLVVSFFEQSNYFFNIGDIYYTRKWECFKVNTAEASQIAIDYIQEKVKNNSSAIKQLELNDELKDNIG